MTCNFHVGQMVVCIDDACAGPEPPPLPTKGFIYTIAGFCDSSHKIEVIGLLFEELPPTGNDEFCACFMPDRFRPVRKTDISALRKLVAPAPEKERVA